MTESKSIVSTLKSIPHSFLAQPLWIKGVGAAVLIGLAFLCFRLIQPSSSTASQYQTTTVDQKSLVSSLSVTGNIAMGSQFGVSSSVTGVVEDVYVKNGDEVTAGQKLFKVKSTASPQEKAAAYASYLSAKNSLANAQAKINSLQAAAFKTNQTFMNGKGSDDNPDVSDPNYIQEKANWLQAEADYKNQAGAVSQAQASLNSALLGYQETQDLTITAPTTGMIANLAIQKGDAVTASNNSTTSNGTTSSTSTTAMYVTNFKDVVLKATVNEVDLPKVKNGQKATITIDAFPNQTFVGTVNRIDMIGTNSSNVVTFNVYISLLSPPTSIGSGMTAFGSIQLDSRDNAMSLPSSALTTANGTSTVKVLTNDNKVEVKTVETGLVTDTETEITSGLSVGDKVITGTTSTSTTKSSSSNSTTRTTGTTGTSVFSGSTGGGFRAITGGGSGPRN